MIEGLGMDGRRVRGEGTWAAARDAYLAGEAAADVCERFDLGLSALRVRARREGWRRSDQPDPDLEAAPDDPACDPCDDGLDGDPPDPARLAEQVWRRAAAAVRRGRLREAQGWTKLWRELNAAAVARAQAQQASAAHRAAVDDACHVGRPITEALRPAAAPRGAVRPEPGEVHSVHSVHPASRAAQAAPPNRAERRRLERLAAGRAAAAGRRTATEAWPARGTAAPDPLRGAPQARDGP